MATEETLMSMIDFDPQFSCVILGKSRCIRPISFAKCVLVIAACVLQVFVIAQYIGSIKSIHNLTFKLISLTFLLYLMIYFSTQLTNKNDIYKINLEIDAEMNVNIALERDWLLSFMTGIYPSSAGTLITFFFVRGLNQTGIPYLASIPANSSILSVAINKYLISKRLRHLRTAVSYMDRVEDTISITRRLLALDKSLNSNYGLLGALFVILQLQICIQVCDFIWAIHGAHKLLTYDPLSSYALGLIHNLLNCCIGFFLAKSSSMISDEVGDIYMHICNV